MYSVIHHNRSQPTCKPPGGLFQPQYMVPAKEKIVLFCPLYVGPFLVPDPRCLMPDCALVGYDTSQGIADITVLGKRLYYACLRTTLSRYIDAQALLLQKTLTLAVT